MKIKQAIFSIISIMFMISCNSCFKEYKNPDSLIYGEKDVVMGILAPDTAIGFTRDYPTEVFVGTMVPTDIDNEYVIEGVTDTVLFQFLLCTRNNYINYYRFDPNAEVYIYNGSQNVKLTYTDKGIYRDINRELIISADSTYHLKVIKNDDQVIEAHTTVPGNFEITSINEDTVYKYIGNGEYEFILEKYGPCHNCFYWISKESANNISFVNIGYTFRDSMNILIQFTKSLHDTTRIDHVNITWEVMAVSKE